MGGGKKTDTTDVWHISGTFFSEASIASSVMEENSFKCKCGDFQGFSSELVNNNDIRGGEYF